MFYQNFENWKWLWIGGLADGVNSPELILNVMNLKKSLLSGYWIWLRYLISKLTKVNQDLNNQDIFEFVFFVEILVPVLKRKRLFNS